MAMVNISEHTGAVLGVWLEVPKIAQNNVAITAGSLPSNPFNANTSIIRINTDAVCSIVFSPTPGATPVATLSDMRCPANYTEYFAVRPGDMVAVIANT